MATDCVNIMNPPLTYTAFLTPFAEKLVDYLLHKLSLNFLENCNWGPSAARSPLYFT